MISVVIAYYNRKQHLVNTLKSMVKSNFKDFEVVVVDDGSDENERIEDLKGLFKFLKIVRINKEDKKHINPCIPLNIGISNTIGNVIIIQNPECFHYNDIFTHVNNNIKKNIYLAYGTVDKNIAGSLSQINCENNSEIKNLLKIDHNISIPTNSWYCHSKFRPEAYNFCVAITREDLKELNGFDERYAFGVERDDVEFLTRIKRKKMDIVFVDNVIVIHQSHKKFYYSQNWSNELRNKNHVIFANTTARENIIKVNPNKIIIK